eukprot:EG_transcript_18110
MEGPLDGASDTTDPAGAHPAAASDAAVLSAPAQPAWSMADLPAIETGQYFGPHSTCNWVIPGRLLAGAFPGDLQEPQHTERVRACLDSGVRTFVCLQPLAELARFNPYPHIARALLGPSAAEVEFLHAPIPDGHVAPDARVRAAAETVIARLLAHRIVYLHCWGGHGRTGTVASIVLGRLYGCPPEAAVGHFQASHRCRRPPRGHFPHSERQLQQVFRLGAEALGSGEGAMDLLPVLEDWEVPSMKPSTPVPRALLASIECRRKEEPPL